MARLNKLEESVLIELLQYKKDKAIELIYRLYWKDLYAYVFSLSLNRSLTEDVLQETFFSIWKYRDQITIDNTVIGYLKTTARNIFIKWSKKEMLDKHFDLDSIGQETPSSKSNSYEDSDSYNHLKIQIQNVVDRMPSQMKDVFLLRKEMELNYRQISEKMNISEATVKKQLYYAMKLVKRYIK